MKSFLAQILVVVANTQMKITRAVEKGSVGAAVGRVLVDRKRQGCSANAGFAPPLEKGRLLILPYQGVGIAWQRKRVPTSQLGEV